MATAARGHAAFRWLVLFVSMWIQVHGFHVSPTTMLKPIAGRSMSLGNRRPSFRMTSASQSSATVAGKEKGGEIAVRYGPHIKIGKKGTILNAWGVWVCAYSMFFAIAGWMYLKVRQLLSVLLFGMLKPRPEHCCWIMHKWCNLVLRLGFSAPKVEGLENLPPKDETVLVCANHMSWFDVPVLHGFLGGRLLWSFAKAELVQVPVLGTYMDSAQHILISRASRRSQLESLKSAIKTLALNRDVFIFPEGTRSLDGKLRDFKGGAFTIARKSGCKIVPVTILGNDEVFPSNAVMPIKPGNGVMKMVVHPAIDPAGKDDGELSAATRDAIASALPEAKA